MAIVGMSKSDETRDQYQARIALAGLPYLQHALSGQGEIHGGLSPGSAKGQDRERTQQCPCPRRDRDLDHADDRRIVLRAPLDVVE